MCAVKRSIPIRIEYFDSVTSTQDLIRGYLASGKEIHGLVIRAAVQTSGRGQRAYDWQSSFGGSYQTLAIKDDDLPMLDKPYVTLAMAVGLATAFTDNGIKLGVKWPNDLYYKGKKVAGVLCEYLKKHLLVGVGVNVNNEVPKGITRLKGLGVETVSNVVLEGLQLGLELVARATNLPKAFARFDILYGQEIKVNFQSDLKFGIAKGIDQNGFIKLETKDECIYLPYGQARIYFSNNLTLPQ